jgi:2-polyprenyl-3-methyl-5-hydroxy-6-metoxy-1,4-benzoquinol methylase
MITQDRTLQRDALPPQVEQTQPAATAPAFVLNPCRLCGTALHRTFVDLGSSPLANSYLEPAQLHAAEEFYRLRAYVCEQCLLVQVPQVESPYKIFGDYAYFSSYSEGWLRHSRLYVDMMIQRFGFDQNSQVIEVASNDGYLLQYFKQKGVPVLGVEPALNVARVAWEQKGIPSVTKFFGLRTAQELVAEGKTADLLIANNVLAHVPDLKDFVSGLKLVLKPAGLLTVEFPHLLRLIEGNQFDTIYHEHLSYLALVTVEPLFAQNGLVLFDVEELPTHGGSLRLFFRHREASAPAVSERVAQVRESERAGGLSRIETYDRFAEKVKASKRKLLQFVVAAKSAGKSIVGYGAAAKGNTLLNYCGIRTDFLDYVVDRSPHKQGLYLPGTHIPTHAPEKVFETKPDYLLILPWNLQEEIREQMKGIRAWGGKFVVPIPEVQIFE